MYWVRSRSNPNHGVVIHVIGDVRHGFELEVKHSHNFNATQNPLLKWILLQWIDRQYFDEVAMLNNGTHKTDNASVCGFEASLYKVKAPEKSLNTVNDKASQQLHFLEH